MVGEMWHVAGSRVVLAPPSCGVVQGFFFVCGAVLFNGTFGSCFFWRVDCINGVVTQATKQAQGGEIYRPSNSESEVPK